MTLPAKSRKTGLELFSSNQSKPSFRLHEFWQWSVSDLVSNTTRGRLAEFIVAKALDIPTDGVRAEWDAFDLLTPAGIKIEVKSAACIQCWKQNRKPVIRFACPETVEWSNDDGKFIGDRKRHADVYVFALLAHTDPATVDPLNLDQWEFYAIPVSELNKRARNSISLKTVQSLSGDPIPFNQLGVAVLSIFHNLTGEIGDVIEIGEDGIHRIHTAPGIFPSP